MRKMKPSGVEWIGDIPQEWEIRSLKYLFDFGKGLPITKADLKESGIAVISYGQIHSKLNTGTHVTDDLIRFVDEQYLSSNYESIVKQKDFIFADTSEDLDGCGNCVYIDTDIQLFAGYHTIILRSRNNNDNKYFAYLFKSDAWRKQIRERVTGVKLFSISQRILKETTVIIPPFPQQQRIAEFLDRKCAEIDSVISKTKATIEQYKSLKQSVITQAVTKGIRLDRPMKDSGDIWIGLIPEDVKLSRTGLHFNIVLGKMLCTDPIDDSYTYEYYYCAANVHFGELSNDGLKQMWFSEKEKQQYLVNAGDLLVVEGGAGAGGCCLVPSQENKTYIQNSIMIVRGKNSNCTGYLRYLIEFLVKSGYVDIVCNKATIPHFTKEKLAAVPFPLFSPIEQQEIADYLDRKCSEIDRLIAAKEQLLTEL